MRRQIVGGIARRALLSCFLPVASCLLAACGGQGGPAERLNQEGNRAYAARDYQAALDSYRRAAAERPDLTDIDYNAGNALHRLSQYDRAVGESQKAAADGANNTRFRAYYALGNHYARQNKWREAYESYRNALVLNPADQDAKFNLEVALRRLTEQQQEQQAQQQQNQQQAQQQGQQPGQQGQQQGQQPGQQGQQQGQQPGQQAQQQGQQPGQQAQQQGQQPGQPSGQTAGGQPGQAPPGAGGSRLTADQELKDALAQFERSISIEDALRILDVIAAEQLRQRSQIPAPPPGSNIRDQ